MMINPEDFDSWTEAEKQIWWILNHPANNYLNLKRLPDGTFIAKLDLLFTRAIVIDLDMCGYHKRFCFEDRSLADTEFEKILTGDDEPVGYIAKRLN